jgi:diguanylate cyclase (GGDEF)-like protein
VFAEDDINSEQLGFIQEKIAEGLGRMDLLDTRWNKILKVMPDDRLKESSEAGGTAHHISANIRIGSETLGSIAIFGAEKFGFSAHANLRMITQEFSWIAKLTLLYEENKLLANTDSTTKLYNYRYFWQKLEEEIRKFKRYGHPLSIVALDIDRFKLVNEYYGHQAGDILLSELGRLLRSTVREVDTAARDGGDEFVVMVPETNVEGAAILAERIRASIEKTPFPAARDPVSITVSVGVVEMNDSFEGTTDLLMAAKKALLKAKEEGMNRVHVHA